MHTPCTVMNTNKELSQFLRTICFHYIDCSLSYFKQYTFLYFERLLIVHLWHFHSHFFSKTFSSTPFIYHTRHVCKSFNDVMLSNKTYTTKRDEAHKILGLSMVFHYRHTGRYVNILCMSVVILILITFTSFILCLIVYFN